VTYFCSVRRITRWPRHVTSQPHGWHQRLKRKLRGHSGTAVQDQVELELEPANVVEAGLGEVLLDMLGEVG
jgi:hypothetical protein